MAWRLIDTDLADPYYVTAADEALALNCSLTKGLNILHFYRRNPPGVSVGYFCNVNDDVDIEQCKNLGIKIVRRTSAGGTIYTDKDQLIFSLISKDPLAKNVEDIFHNVCDCIISALAVFGIISKFKSPNDIIINNKKISGSAQVKKKNVYLIHGTIILSLDQDRLESVLKNYKPDYLSSIETECGFKPKLQTLKSELRKAFEKRFGVTINKDEFNNKEKDLIFELIEKKYSASSWIFKR